MRDLWLVAAVLSFGWVAAARCQEGTASAPLPEGDNGIAARYLGDVGIEKDPAVVFADFFETGATKADNAWGAIVYTSQAENVHGGKYAMELTLPWPRPEKEIGLGMQHHFKAGFDVLYLRYYAKYGKDTELYHGGTHNGGSIAARAPGVPDAKPGIPADGRNEYTVLLDTWRPEEQVRSPGNLAVYCYHPEQRHQWGEHFFPTGETLPFGRARGSLFGKEFVSRPDVIPERDRWYCYELMVRANTPGQRDGRIAFWVDGKLIADFPNLRLRDVETLKANRIGLGLYTQNGKIQKPCTMWYDDVVAATSYIGPLLREKKAEPKPAASQTPKAPLPPDKPRPPAIKSEALAPWEAKLAERVARGIKDGQRPTPSMKVMGAREEPVKVVGTDEKSLSVDVRGGTLSLPWARLSASDRLNLARACLKEGVLEDHVLVAVFALADGRAELSEEHFAKAKAADPKGGEARVSEVRASLGLK
ncbi:MAG: hypothetical protein NTW87_03850 [Planctomycetota bacterium]|nr:hypothetical protein [Planctomycetota bacterium]